MPNHEGDFGLPLGNCLRGLFSSQLVDQLWLPAFSLADKDRQQAISHVEGCPYCKSVMEDRIALRGQPPGLVNSEVQPLQ